MAVFATINEDGRVTSIKQCPDDTILQENEYDVSFYKKTSIESLLFAKYDPEKETFEFDDHYDVCNAIINDTFLRDGSWIEGELNVILNDMAVKYGYDNIISAVSYQNSSVEKYSLEGKAFSEWRDNVWNWYFDHLKRIETENIYPVARSQIRSEIPQFMDPFEPQIAKSANTIIDLIVDESISNVTVELVDTSNTSNSTTSQ